jgi:TolB-like protein
MDRTPTLRTVSIVIFCIAITSCGYHFAGGENNLPPDIRSVAVLVFENRSSEPGIENDFTNDLVYEFTRGKLLAIAEKDSADAVLTGIIKQLGSQAITYTKEVVAAEQRVYVVLDVRLKRSDNGDVLWSDESFTEKEEYTVIASDKAATEANKRAAIKELSERSAEKIHNRIFQGF